MERKLQAEIIKWLKAQGAYVIKNRAGPGVPVGCPDILALWDERWLAIEVKSSARAAFGPGQQATLNLLMVFNGYVYIVYPENWINIRGKLLDSFF